MNVNASRLANAGGNWNNGSNAGAFHLNVNQSASNTNTNIVSLLVGQPSTTMAILSPTKVGIIFDISKHFVINLQKICFICASFCIFAV